jgi:hypothetical protein
MQTRILCPQCRSSNLDGLRTLHDESVRFEPTSSDNDGPWELIRDIFQIVLSGHVLPPGTSRSLLSDRICPPLKKSHARAVLVAGLGFSLAVSGGWGLVLSLPFFCVAFILISATNHYNRNEWPQLFESWSTMLFCKQCSLVINPN